ncbi:MAG: NfeD family protein [Eubacterium sp.]|nr:NfeD family protein [Eubacterium sp.]
MIWIWIAVIVAAIVVEVASMQLLSIWFAIGGVAALITSFLTQNIVIQIVVFAVVSAIALALIFPAVRRSLKKEHVKTNADRYIGKLAVVTENISNIDAKGQVKVDNQIWSARSNDGRDLPVGTKVVVLRIEGVKLIVSAAE